MSNYEIRRYSSSGTMLDITNAIVSLSSVRTENNVGALELVVPCRYKYEDFSKCQIIEIWNSKHGGSMSLIDETAYFLQDWEFITKGGERLIRLLAYDANWLLATRIVAYDAGSAQADMTDYADDMIKAIVTDAMGGDAISARQLSGVTIDSDLSDAPSITKAFSRRNVLKVLREIAEASSSGGTNLYFDMIRTGIGTFAFRTFTGQRGQDHGRDSGDVRLVGEQYGNFDDITFGTYHSDEENYIYAGGQGEEADREVVEVSDSTRINVGYPWNRVEGWEDARHCDTTAGVTAEANSALREGRPKQVLSGRLIDTPGMRLDVHYGFGDIVSAEAFGFSVDCHVSNIRRTYDPNNGERIDARLRGEV